MPTSTAPACPSAATSAVTSAPPTAATSARPAIGRIARRRAGTGHLNGLRRVLPMTLRLGLLAGLWMGAAATTARAAPLTTPTDDQAIVERLPLRFGDRASARAEREQRRQLRAQPQNLPLALQQARQALMRARGSGDPRELGVAQAALAPWWSQARPPPAVQLLRAMLRQSQHEFAPALADLDALLQPQHEVPLAVRAQAELTRASLLQVQGRWAEAEQGCRRLAGPAYATLGEAVRRPAQVCQAELLSLRSSDAAAQREADRQLQRLARDAAGSADAAWIALVRAERAARQGDPAAGALYRQASSATPDAYTLASHADWLLAQGQAAAVLRLLAEAPEADALLLRRAIAWQQLGDERAHAARDTLAERFEAALRRGDLSHAREQALHALHLRHDAAAALALAQRNWQAQKEPADALLLVQAARAAGQPDAAQPVRQFAAERGWHDPRWDAPLRQAQLTPAAQAHPGRAGSRT